jgi:hypothetical protein
MKLSENVSFCNVCVIFMYIFQAFRALCILCLN